MFKGNDINLKYYTKHWYFKEKIIFKILKEPFKLLKKDIRLKYRHNHDLIMQEDSD